MRVRWAGICPICRSTLKTGKSPKFDPEKILGLWNVDVRATWVEERKANPNMNARQVAGLRTTFLPQILDLRLTATTDNQMILEQQNANGAQPAVVDHGSWKNEGGSYEITFPKNKPGTVAVTPGDDGTLRLPWQGHLCLFNKEM